MAACPQYLSGVTNNVWYYYAFLCDGHNTPCGMTSSGPLSTPCNCNTQPLPADCTGDRAQESDRALTRMDQTCRHAFKAKNAPDPREGIVPTSADSPFWPDPHNGQDGTSSTSLLLDRVVKIKDANGGDRLVRLFLLEHTPPTADNRPTLLITFGQEVLISSTGTDVYPGEEAHQRDRKYYTVKYGGLTYHVLLKRDGA